MPFTNFGRERVALSLGSDISNNLISYFNVGSGSGTATITDTTLINEYTRFAITGSPDFTALQKATFVGDLNSIQASGLLLSEFGMLQSGAALTGSIWFREGLGSLQFDGTNELKLEVTLEVTN